MTIVRIMAIAALVQMAPASVAALAGIAGDRDAAITTRKSPADDQQKDERE